MPSRRCGDADLVITATGLDRDAPFVLGDWIKPGATVCGLGSYQELDETVITRARRIFVDHREGCAQRGNIAPLIKAGRLGQDRIDGEVAELVAGRLVGRASADETVVIALIGIGFAAISRSPLVRSNAPPPAGWGRSSCTSHAFGRLSTPAAFLTHR